MFDLAALATIAEFDRVRHNMIPNWERIIRQPGFLGKQAVGR